MNIYKITTDKDAWDTYDSLVLCATDYEDARRRATDFSSDFDPAQQKIEVFYIGEAAIMTKDTFIEGTVICASFNAG